MAIYGGYRLYCRHCLAIIIILLSPLAGIADGFAFGKGFTPQLWETHQVAVINLTEKTADVSMFIAIEGIPEGQEVTYILPFWYHPDGFSLTEETASLFWDIYGAPAHEQMLRTQRIVNHFSSNKLLLITPFISFGLSTLILPPILQILKEDSWKVIVPFMPYAIDETAHARIEWYRVGTHDLQRLIHHTGLPERYLKPLVKYHTPYFAVMHLKGLSHKKSIGFSSKGIRYHFTHRIAGGCYTYPLGTGAAWPQPIPITEVYLTCPDNLVMEVKSPIEGKQIDRRVLYTCAEGLRNYFGDSREEQRKDFQHKEEMKKFLASPWTSFLFDPSKRHPFAWHIAYLQSNPSEDISVRLVKRFAPWRLSVVDYFESPGVLFCACFILYLFSWYITTQIIIRRRWQHAGCVGTLFLHSLQIFVKAQVNGLIVSVVYIFVFEAIANVLFAMGFPQLNIILNCLFAAIIATVLTILLAIITRRFVFSKIICFRLQPTGWSKGVTLTSWLCTCIFFSIMAAMFYGLLYWCETI